MISWCNLSKVFDVVSQDIIISQLQRYGIDGAVLQNVVVYLADRQQFVSLKGASTTVKTIAHRVRLLMSSII